MLFNLNDARYAALIQAIDVERVNGNQQAETDSILARANAFANFLAPGLKVDELKPISPDREPEEQPPPP